MLNVALVIYKHIYISSIKYSIFQKKNNLTKIRDSCRLSIHYESVSHVSLSLEEYKMEKPLKICQKR